MSLILEALRKLDREKQAPDRGMVVVGPSAWATARERGPLTGAAAVVLAVGAVAAVVGVIWLLRGHQPARQTTQAAAVPTAAVPAATAPGPAGVAETRPAPQAPILRTAPAKPGPSVKAAPTREATPRTAAVEPDQPASGEEEAAGAAEGPPARETARVAERKPAPGTVSLQAISAQDGHPVAILNDRLVREGDSFDGIRVVRIGADEVEIEVHGRRRVVKF